MEYYLNWTFVRASVNGIKGTVLFNWGLRQKSRYINTNSIDRIDFPSYKLYVV